MRRATWVGVATLLLAALLGLLRAGHNIDDEVDAAMSLADVVACLGNLAALDDQTALAQLHEMQRRAPLRHLELRVHDVHARLLLGPPLAPPAPAWLDGLYGLHRRLTGDGARRIASWRVARPHGPDWRVSLASSHESERHEAVNDLLGVLMLLGAGIALLLLVMQANVRHALRPLGALLQTIRDIEEPDHRATDALRSLPQDLPTRELAVIAAALRHLALALDEASAERRALSQKVLSLQEDERAHLARELHDEFGQRLTALRLDATWLQRQLADAPPARRATPAELQQVVRDMADRCAEVQADIRDLLVRLRPLGPGATAVAWTDVIAQLEALVQSWQATAARHEGAHRALATRFHFDPGPAGGAPAQLPRDIALALYRLSQEALTNIARHAHASQAGLSLRCAPPDPQGCISLTWQVQDDGVGIPDQASAVGRGNGLGGMQERVWALGGDWQASRPTGTTGLLLRARLSLPGSAPGLR
ncbi:MAG: hypothetical protein RLZZ584_788 [Pseudomonadota bacterium]|jgi:two-component system sensor histidine kinase UhpB